MSSHDNIVDEFLTGHIGVAINGSELFCADSGFRNHHLQSGYDNKSSNIQLKTITELAPEHRECFSNYDTFNEMQSMVFDLAYHSDDNLVIGAPTASGKTTIMELAILRLFSQHSHGISEVKAVYIAPLKALCNERMFDWQQKFRNQGLTCVQFTGDSDTDIYRIAPFNIIITTPEKFDASSRRWAHNRFFFDQIALIMVDEIHTVDDSRGRGGCLEALLTRCLTISRRKNSESQRCPASSMRFIALSATAPNVSEIGNWLKAKAIVFGNEFRPVPLQCHVLGYRRSPASSYFQFDNSLNFKIVDIIQQYADGKPTLVFCCSKSGCFNCAKTIISSARQSGIRFVNSPEQEQVLYNVSCQIKDSMTKELVRNGVGIHNATLSPHDRYLVQENFLLGNIMVVCSTTTLAQGVNLPAHLVIVKGTQIYNQSNGNAEHPTATILQMIGRAGRPQFDKFGVAVIMTTTNMVTYYKNLSSRQKAVESHLSENAIEHVNAEISLRTITSMNEAIDWMNNTFASIRMLACPAQFGISAHEASNSESFRNVLERRMRHCIESLAESGMVTIKQNSNLIESTKLGTIMANYYLKLATARSISTLSCAASMFDILSMLCCSSEFLDLPIRQGEKKQLNAANKAGIRYPIKGKVKDLADKISILLQTAMESSALNPFQSVLLNQDLRNALDISQRILHGAISYLDELKDHFSAYLNCFILRKALHMRMWSDSPQVIRQIEGIGPKKLAQLVNAGITTIEKLRNTSIGKIEALCDRNAPFGLQVKQKLRNFPILRFDVTEHDNRIQVDIEQSLAEFESKNQSSISVFIGISNQYNLHCRKIRLCSGISKHHIELKEYPKLNPAEVTVAAIMDSISGCDFITKFPLNQTHKNHPSNITASPLDLNQKNQRKSKHEHSLEEQNKIMRKSLEQSPSKKVKILTPSISQKQQIHAIPVKPIIQKSAKTVQSSTEHRLVSIHSNIGYKRSALGIRSVNDVSTTNTKNQLPPSGLGAEMKNCHFAIGRHCSSIKQDFNSDELSTGSFGRASNLDSYRYCANATTSKPPMPLSNNCYASGQLAIQSTGGAKLTQPWPSGKDDNGIDDIIIPKSAIDITGSSAIHIADPVKQAVPNAAKCKAYDFCDEQLVFSSLFDD